MLGMPLGIMRRSSPRRIVEATGFRNCSTRSCRRGRQTGCPLGRPLGSCLEARNLASHRWNSGSTTSGSFVGCSMVVPWLSWITPLSSVARPRWRRNGIVAQASSRIPRTYSRPCHNAYRSVLIHLVRHEGKPLVHCRLSVSLLEWIEIGLTTLDPSLQTRVTAFASTRYSDHCCRC